MGDSNLHIMFGGGGGFGGASFGGGGAFGGATDNDPNRLGGGGGLEAGGFNAIPGGGAGFGGYGGAPGMQQASQGLGGYLRNGTQSLAPGENGEGQPQKQGQQRDQQSMMPLTLRMLLDAHERSRQSAEQQGPDAPLVVNGKEVSMFTFVGILEKVGMEQIYKVFQVCDGTARMTVKQYHDTGTGANEQEWQLGEYVRVFGTFRYWGGDFHVSAHHVARVENPNEVPFHFIEVAHVHLSLAGRIQKQAPTGGAASGVRAPGGGNPASAPSSVAGGFQSAPGGVGIGGPSPGQPGFGGGGGGTLGFGGAPAPAAASAPWAGGNSTPSAPSSVPGGFSGGAPGGGRWDPSAFGLGGAGAGSAGVGGGGGQAGPGDRFGTRAGDWACPNCGLNVWGSKDSCFKCGATKPLGGQGQPSRAGFGGVGGQPF